MIRITDGASDSDVSTPNAAYRSMCEDWALVHDLMGYPVHAGLGERWLPKEPKESDAAYRNRLDRSVLLTGSGGPFKHWLESPFNVRLLFSDTAHPAVRRLTNNVDRAGRNLTVFARGSASFCFGRRCCPCPRGLSEPGEAG